MIKEPLGIPRGSVRAMLALMLIGSTCFLWVTGGTVPDAMLVLDGTALAFYFDTRARAVADSGDYVPAPSLAEHDAG